VKRIKKPRKNKINPGTSFRDFISQIALIALGAILVFGLKTDTRRFAIGWHWPLHKPQQVIQVQASSIQDPVASEAESGTAQVVGKFVPVLMYHHVEDLGKEQRSSDPIRSDLTVSTSDFEQQVKYFHDLGYQTISVEKLYNNMENGTILPSKPIIFTFDDGYQDVFFNAIPILQKYGYTGSFAIATELLGRPSYATWDDVLLADRLGMEILSHTENHLDLTNPKYSDDDLTREILGSKNIFEGKLGHSINFFVYPYGHINYHVGELVATSGYKMAFTTEFGFYMNPKTLIAEPRVRVHGLEGLEKLKKIWPN